MTLVKILQIIWCTVSISNSSTLYLPQVIVSKVPASAHIPSQSTAPTAAVKPTVTTTPTASIRPMGIQTTSAPTAHVTPTMVTTQHLIPCTAVTQLPVSITSSSTTAAAAVFVRSTSPQILPPHSSTTTGGVTMSVDLPSSLTQPSISMAAGMASMAAISAATVSVHPVQGTVSPPTLAAVPALVTAEMVSTSVQSHLPRLAVGGVSAATRVSPSVSSLAPPISAMSAPAPAPISSAVTTCSGDVPPPAMASGLTSVNMSASSAGMQMSVDPFQPTANRPSTSLVTPSATHVCSSTSTIISPPASAIVTTMISSSPHVQVSLEPMAMGSPLAMEAQSDGSGSVRGKMVVVGRVGTSEDKQQQLPIPSGGIGVKRKRADVAGEPGSSLEPPTSKKRHIRLRQRERVQVSASSSTVPDTQGTSMERAARKVHSIHSI